MFLKKKSNVRNSIKRLWLNYANLIYPTKSSNTNLNDKASDTKNERDKECLGKKQLFQYIINEKHKVYPNINQKPIIKLHVH